MKPRKILGSLVGVCLVVLAAALGPTPAAAQPRAYVSNEGSNNVSVINTNTNMVINTLDVGPGPKPVAVSPNGRFVYVANHGINPNTISVIDTNTDTVVATILVGMGPTRVGFSINSACAYAVNEGSNNITVIDTGSMTVVDTVATGPAPRPGAGTPRGDLGVVLIQGANEVWVYDLTSGCSNLPPTPVRIPIDIIPRVALITPDGAFLYVLGVGSNVTVIDMTNLGGGVLTTVPVEQPSGGDISPNGKFLYVTSGVSDSVFVIDTDPGSGTFNQVVDIIRVGNGPLGGGAFRPNGSLFLLSNANPQFLEIDTDPQSPTYKSVVCTRDLPRLTDDDRGAITRDGATLYITNRLANTVIPIDVSGCLVESAIPVGTNPTRLAVTPF